MANPEKSKAKANVEKFIDAVKDRLPKNALLSVGIRANLNRRKFKELKGAGDGDAMRKATTYSPTVRINLPVPAVIKAAVEEYITCGGEDTSVVEVLDGITIGGRTNKVEVKYL